MADVNSKYKEAVTWAIHKVFETGQDADGKLKTTSAKTRIDNVLSCALLSAGENVVLEPNMNQLQMSLALVETLLDVTIKTDNKSNLVTKFKEVVDDLHPDFEQAMYTLSTRYKGDKSKTAWGNYVEFRNVLKNQWYPIWNNLTNKNGVVKIPSGKQLKELLEKFLSALYLLENNEKEHKSKKKKTNAGGAAATIDEEETSGSAAKVCVSHKAKKGAQENREDVEDYDDDDDDEKEDTTGTSNIVNLFEMGSRCPIKHLIAFVYFGPLAKDRELKYFRTLTDDTPDTEDIGVTSNPISLMKRKARHESSQQPREYFSITGGNKGKLTSQEQILLQYSNIINNRADLREQRAISSSALAEATEVAKLKFDLAETAIVTVRTDFDDNADSEDDDDTKKMKKKKKKEDLHEAKKTRQAAFDEYQKVLTQRRRWA